MTLLLYAVAEGQPRVSGEVSGLGGRPLFGVSAETGLTAFVSDSSEPIATAPATLREYEHAVECLMRSATVLPARFGTTLADEASATDLLRARGDELTAALARVRGAVEMGLRANWPTEAPVPGRESSSPGADYLRAKLQREHRARELADRLHAAIDGLARERACRILPRPQTPVAAAYLVDRERVADFVARVEELREDAELVCTGPWPPYSFVGGEQR